MTRDRNTVKRDLFVIPGGLLAAYGLTALLYVLFVRSDSTTSCRESTRFLVGGACYNVVPLLLVLFILGLALLAVGILVFRGTIDRLEGHLHSGSPTHFALALLVSFVVFPAIAALTIRYVERANGTLLTTTLGGTDVKTEFLFALASLAGALMLAPFAILLGRSAVRRNRFLAEARRVAPPAPGEIYSGSSVDSDRIAIPPGAEVVDDDADWPVARESR